MSANVIATKIVIAYFPKTKNIDKINFILLVIHNILLMETIVNS